MTHPASMSSGSGLVYVARHEDLTCINSVKKVSAVQ